jgi:hypothetical protein
MSARSNPVPHPWRSYLRFSVRGLIVFVLVIGAGLGWVLRDAHIQRDAVAAVIKAGGNLLHDWQWSNGKPVPGGKPWAPEWLTNLIGVDYFSDVTAVRVFSSSSTTDATIAKVARLPRLENLSINSPNVGDAGIAHLEGSTNLTYLNLMNTHVTDAGLVHLRNLTNLSELLLCETAVTDAGLAHLKGLSKLSYLHLRGSQVTETGMDELKRALPSLTIHP